MTLLLSGSDTYDGDKQKPRDCHEAWGRITKLSEAR